MQRQITPTAEKQLAWIAQTYSPMHKDVDAWCEEITRGVANDRKPKSEVRLIDILEELEGLTTSPKSDWALTAQRFREAGWIDKLKALRTLLAQRQPLNRERVATRQFRGLSDGCLEVEVATVYESDLTRKTVTFYAFWSYTPDPPEPTQGNVARKW